MAGTNEFLPVATGGGANVITQAAYEALTSFLANGYSSGVVESDQFNKVIRQSSFMAAVIGQLVANAEINASDDGDLPGFVTDLILALRSFSPPPGTVIHVAMNTAPTGFLKANGAAISRATYAALFTAIGTTFGSGDGSTTFNVPDLRGEFLRGWDDSRGIDAARVFGSSQLDAFQGHGHDITYPYTGASGGSLGTSLNTSVEPNILANTVTNPNTLGAYGTPRIAAETRPRNISLLACIKF